MFIVAKKGIRTSKEFINKYSLGYSGKYKALYFSSAVVRKIKEIDSNCSRVMLEFDKDANLIKITPTKSTDGHKLGKVVSCSRLLDVPDGKYIQTKEVLVYKLES